MIFYVQILNHMYCVLYLFPQYNNAYNTFSMMKEIGHIKFIEMILAEELVDKRRKLDNGLNNPNRDKTYWILETREQTEPP